MPPVRTEKEKKRSINVILTPNPKEFVKRLRAENCAVNVYNLSGAPAKTEASHPIVTRVTRSKSRRQETSSSSSSSSSSDTSETRSSSPKSPVQADSREEDMES